ncbi:MAG: redox-regulated ATPase YchF [Elusimicrobia bacterium]|nr:redox-regulated ATPase YchF [Elusimicrobiota bacterium]
MEIGIVGLPNVGKSTLFNALTSGHAASSNYPFTTIDPNVGVVSVPDARLKRLTEIFKSEKTVPAAIRFVDIAGLVQGASEGQGLGNKFLANIREVDAIVHIVRFFSNHDVVHVMGGVEPKRDIEVINTELVLADLTSVEVQLDKAQSQAKSGEKTAIERYELAKKIHVVLAEGKPVRSMGLPQTATRSFGLLTDKPVLYVGNTDEPGKADPALVKAVEQVAKEDGAGLLVLCGKLEAEIAELEGAEREMFLKEMGLTQSGLDRLIKAAYELLGLITFLTAGPKETRAWTITKGTLAPQAAGKIHTDMESGFIRADVYRFSDMDRLGSEAALREKGLIRSEGKTYEFQDGDVVFFHFNPPRGK